MMHGQKNIKLSTVHWHFSLILVTFQISEQRWQIPPDLSCCTFICYYFVSYDVVAHETIATSLLRMTSHHAGFVLLQGP